MKRQIVVSPATFALGAGLVVAVLIIVVLATVMLTGGGDASAPPQSAPPSTTSTMPATATPSPSAPPTTVATETPAPSATPATVPSATVVPLAPTSKAVLAPQPTLAPRDTVVGVAMLCDGRAGPTSGNVCWSWQWGDEMVPPCPACGHTPVFSTSNLRYSITVRTSVGATYVVTLPFSVAVQEDAAPRFNPPPPSLGSAWPP